MKTLKFLLSASALMVLMVQASWAQRMVFSTETGKIGIVAVSFSDVKDNKMDVNLVVTWVDPELKPLTDRLSVIGFDPRGIEFSSNLVRYLPIANTDIFAFNSTFTFRVELDERFPGGDINLKFPFFYAPTLPLAMVPASRIPFSFTRPRAYLATAKVDKSKLVDKTPPLLAIVTPEGVSQGLKPIIESETVRIKLNASDFFGVEKVTINNIVAQKLSDSLYVADIMLRFGFESPITVIAQDVSGLRTTTNFAIESRRPVAPVVAAQTANQPGATAPENQEQPRELSPLEIDIPDIGITFPHRFALIIGNEDYSTYQRGLRTESDVEFAIRDAETFKLYAKKVLGIPEANIILHTNATAIEMSRALNQINAIAKITEGKAEIFVMYAGHGFPDEKTQEPYLIPVDVSGSDLKFAIKLSDLYAKLTEHPTKRVTVFIDACFSGGGREQGLLAARAVKVRPRENPLQGNLIVFAAASGDQSALPWKEMNHGMFTYHVLNKLKETKGELTYGELSDYLRINVATRSVLVNQKEQNPQTNISPAVRENWRNWTMR